MHVFGSAIEKAAERFGHAVNASMKEIDSKKEQPFSPRGVLESSILVQLWDWLTSTKLELNNPIIKRLSEFNEIISKQVMLSTIHQCIPFFSYLPANHDIKRAKQTRNTIFPKAYQAQKETYTPGVIRNLIDSFISCCEKEIGKKTKKDIGSMDDIAGLMADVSFGGSDTTCAIFAL